MKIYLKNDDIFSGTILAKFFQIIVQCQFSDLIFIKVFRFAQKLATISSFVQTSQKLKKASCFELIQENNAFLRLSEIFLQIFENFPSRGLRPADLTREKRENLPPSKSNPAYTTDFLFVSGGARVRFLINFL